MNKYFVQAWDKNKGSLENYFRTHNQEEYSDYKTILQNILELVINDHNDIGFKYESDNIKTIDYGDYQGTLLFVFCEDAYQPDENQTYYTVVDYGSCSGCDTLQRISHYDDELPTEEQIKDYMSLALHMIQHIKCFGESDLEC